MECLNFIPFNKPYLIGREIQFINEAISLWKLSGNGVFTKKSHNKFKSLLKNQYNLLTTSCTDALEMTAILANIRPGDEIIMPTYTFVSTANAFILRGAKIIFVDSREDHPGMNEKKIEEVINEKTIAIVPVHYAGVACDMDKILAIAKKYNLVVIEDAAQAIDSFYNGKPLGSIGDMGCFSFHETKNIQCGEGGLLAINNSKFTERAEIIWEKGTNRSAFWRGEVDKYNWVDIGSSFLPSEITAAFLHAQLEEIENIQNKRKAIWNQYNDGLVSLKNIGIRLPNIPYYATNNAHMFYLVCRSQDERTQLIEHLKQNNINAVFHYICLHDSPYYHDKHDGKEMPNAKIYEECLVRLPLWVNMSEKEVNYVIQKVLEFYKIGSIKVN
jgi:dTDP-4-amino-4,6-dideoxygalactose transaminase